MGSGGTHHPLPFRTHVLTQAKVLWYLFNLRRPNVFVSHEVQFGRVLVHSTLANVKVEVSRPAHHDCYTHCVICVYRAVTRVRTAKGDELLPVQETLGFCLYSAKHSC